MKYYNQNKFYNIGQSICLCLVIPDIPPDNSDQKNNNQGQILYTIYACNLSP